MRSGPSLICWPRDCGSFQIGERSVKKNFSLPMKRSFQLRVSQLFPEACPSGQQEAPTPNPGRSQRALSLKENTDRGGRERSKHGVQRRKHLNISHTSLQLHTATRPHCVPSRKYLPVSGPPSNEDGAVCARACAHARTHARTPRPLSPRLHLITLMHCSSSTPQTLNAHHNPALLPSCAAVLSGRFTLCLE